jgi:short subunit dehydrogenase-like uncharacterized protein
MWMIYGASGYTGELIAREAARRGMRPLLAGRNAASIEPLARELSLEWRAFDLSAPQLEGISLVLHCAGPFIRTSRPMVDACLSSGVHYLDITGEIAVFESVFQRHDEAVTRGITLLPGVGFDVVPTDCLALSLAEQMPDASDLSLAFYTRGGEISRGTLKTMIEGLGEGGAVRRDGRIVRVPVAYDVREIPFSCGPRTAMTIPWGDVSTAYRTTHIPNIRVYTASSPRAVARARRLAKLEPLLALRPVKWMLQKYADRRTGPGASVRGSARIFVWGSVRNAAGSERSATLTVPEGYQFTVLSSLASVERVLRGDGKAGAWTPASLFGSGFVRTIDGVTD